MQGKMTTIKPDGTITVMNYDHELSLDVLQKAVDGLIVVIPFFTEYEGQECVAFCNDEGKIHELPINELATKLWKQQTPLDDVLHGAVVIVQGDAEFMDAL